MAYRAKGEPDRAVPDFDPVIKAYAERRHRLLQSRPRLSRHARLRPRHPGLRSGAETQSDANRGASTTAAWPMSPRARSTTPSQDFDQAIQVNPKDLLAYNNRGLAYRNKGETDPPSRITTRRSDQARITRSPTTTAATPITTSATTTAPSRTTTRRSRSIRNTRSPITIAASPTMTARIREGGSRSDQGDQARSEGLARLLQPRHDLSRHRRDRQGARRFRPVDQDRSEERAALLQPRPGLPRQGRS